MYNKIETVGRVQKDPILKTTTNGKEILTFSIDFNYNNRNKNLDFITVVMFDRLAKIYKDQIKNNMLLKIDGKLETHSFFNKNEQKIKTFNIAVETVEILDDSEEGKYLNKNYLLNNQNHQE